MFPYFKICSIHVNEMYDLFEFMFNLISLNFEIWYFIYWITKKLKIK